MKNAPLQQMGEHGHARVPHTSMQAMDVQKQQGVIGPINGPSVNAPIRQQPKSPRTQLHQQQQQALHRSMSVSPTRDAGLHRSMSTSPIPHPGQFVGTQQPARRMSSPQQVHDTPTLQDRGLPLPSRSMRTFQDGRSPSPTKRASFDPQLESVVPPFSQDQQRYPSPTKRKTVVVNPTSSDTTSRPQMVPAQQVASPRKSMMQQGQPLSPRKSTMMMPQSQPLSPRKSMMQQHEQLLSPRKSMLSQQAHATSSLTTYPEHSTPSSQQENIPAAASYINHRSMSMSPVVQVPPFDDDGDDAYNDDNSHARPVNRATTMSPVAPNVRFQGNEGVILPTTSNNHPINRSMSFSPAAQSMKKQQQVSLLTKMQPNMNARMRVPPRQIQTQQPSQQPSSPARLQSSISRSMSISPTQMNAEQQPQPRLSSVHLAAVQGMVQKSLASSGVLQGGIFGNLGVYVC